MEKAVGLVILSLIAVLVALIYFEIQQEKEWEMFKVIHHCKIISKISGSVAIGVAPIIGGNGDVAISITPIPGKTGWQCDDGVTYFK